MKTSLNSLFDIFNDTEAMVRDYPDMGKAFKPIALQFSEKKSKPDASIMVYGVYNAGKSTLINALIGQNIAPAGDIPLTDRVDEYRWGQYAILDTPGVDAPLAHEKVTREQMLKADAIIFVVNPSGAAEEIKTLQVIIDLLANGKKLFLVFNEKNPLSLEDFIQLKNKTRERLQLLAEAHGIHGVLADIPIFRVNAQRALKGKLEQKSALLNNSGFPAFEAALTTFIDGITQDDVYARLAGQLNNFLAHFIETLTKNAGSETVCQYDTLLRNLVTAQGNCRKEIKNEIGRNRTTIYERSKSALRQDPQQSQSKIEGFYQDACANASRVLQDEMEFLANQFNNDVAILEAALLHRADNNGVKINSVNLGAETAAVGDKPSALSHINADMLHQVAGTVGKMAKPEHIVTGLKIVKDWMPSVMKGIGAKTMEKWGAAVVGKWIPMVGPAITVLSGLWDIFADDPEEKQLSQQLEQQQRERERFMQEVDDIAQDIANQYESAMTGMIAEGLEPWLSEMKQKVADLLASANQNEQEHLVVIAKAQQLLIRLTPDNA